MTCREKPPAGPKYGGATYPLSHRLERAAWNLIWSAFGIWTPAPLHRWRRFLLCAFGAQLARNAYVYPGVKVWYPKNLQMGEYACLGPGVICYCMDLISIEPFALVSQRAHLCAGTHDVDDPDFRLVTKPIHIGRNAWVAAEAFVGPGVTVPRNAVLGARAVAMKDLEEGKIYAGNPARLLRSRSVTN
ncbi:putative colanic acid biosynthesis acetyltransferase [Bradyrhizobium sp. NC92]|uniref:putative colanic acid biosynthesis acetyltransferase n=1 Tax=Bradyrhizobium sp. (strain NC92) TaxID=55395 RepID=UPI0039060E8B